MSGRRDDKNEFDEDDATDPGYDELVFVDSTTPAAQEEGGFDYASFEMDMEQRANVEKQETENRVPESGPAVRATLPNRPVPEDVTFSTRERGHFTIVTLRGRVNESFEPEALAPALKGKVVFELSGVDRVTSFGVRGWLKMLQLANLEEAYFVRCSEAIVNQITMMANFTGPAQVHSIVAPYVCGACGAEFGVPFFAIEDRKLLEARRAPDVACPECHSAAEMDEDPWAFFALDDQLMEQPPSADLSRVIESLGDAPKVVPIEKVLSGSVTRIRFNEAITERTRFRRAFSALEGDIVLDLAGCPSVSQSGGAKLLDELRGLDRDVKDVQVEGATEPLLRALIEHPIDRVVVVSALMRARSGDLERTALVEIERHQRALGAGRVPPMDAAWAQGTVEIVELGLAQRAAELWFAPDPTVEATPIAPVAAPVASGGGGKVVAGIAVAAVLIGLGVLGVGAAVMFSGGGTTEPVVVAPQEGMWSTGEAEAPAWSGQDLQNGPSGLLAVGNGTGGSLSEATNVAQSNAEASVATALLEQLGQSEVVTSGAYAIPAEMPDFDVPTLQLKQTASRKDDGAFEVFSQFSLPADVRDEFLGGHGQLVEFRGLTLAPSPPWEEPALHVVKTESWFKVPKGATLEALAGQPLTTPSEFQKVTSATWSALAPGSSFTLTFDNGGEKFSEVFRKRGAPQPAPSPVAAPTPSPAPRAPELLPLDNR